jgi:hypothetical protein
MKLSSIYKSGISVNGYVGMVIFCLGVSSLVFAVCISAEASLSISVALSLVSSVAVFLTAKRRNMTEYHAQIVALAMINLIIASLLFVSTKGLAL